MIKKRFLLVLSLITAILLLCGCNTVTTATPTVAPTTDATPTAAPTTAATGTITLPDLTGKSTTEVVEYFENLGIEYKVSIKGDLLYGDEEGMYEFDTFYGYAGSGRVPGASFDTSKRLTVYVTAQALPATIDEIVAANADALSDYSGVTLEGKAYEGKSFLTTGLGEVTVTNYVDGDTTGFKDKNGTTFSLRYLGVDTPESTAAFEPWGKAASNYTKSCLQNAKEIVLEAESAGQKDGNGRYLGWVWYLDSADEWHLLNLELIAFCYSKDKASTDSMYCDIAVALGIIAASTGRRVNGEHDPAYDYSTEPKEISLEELRTNFAEYYGRRVKVTGVIAFMDSTSPYIIDEATGYGIYYYIPTWTNAAYTYQIKLGNKVSIEGVATYYGSSDDVDLDSLSDDLANGSPQLSDFKSGCVTLISQGNTVEPRTITISSLATSSIGMYVTMNNLTITEIYTATSGSGTSITCKDSSNKEIVIRVDSSHYYIAGSNETGIKIEDYKVGDKITSVTGGLSYYYGYQISVVDTSNIVK